MTLTKLDLVDQVAQAAAMPRKDATRSVEAVLELIKSALANGDPVLVSGFGTFVVNRKTARRGRNPQTGGDFTLYARAVVTFHGSRVLKGLVNGDGARPLVPCFGLTTRISGGGVL